MSRMIAGVSLNPLGFGCMNVNHGYGAKLSVEEGVRLIHRAIDLGVEHLDTAALYGFGRNEEVVGEALKDRRDRVFLASKCGMTGVDGKRVIDGRPQTIKATCEAALTRLGTGVIDLYYLHRLDPAVPVEESVGALADLKAEGKILGIGLSEVSAVTLYRAHAVHPIAAVQTEYSLWTRNAEIGVLEACQDLGVAFVAFSPLARGFLAGGVRSPDFAAGDIRRSMPRFQEPNLSANLALYEAFAALAQRAEVAPSQLALAWVLSRGEHVHVIPGTTSEAHLVENMQTPQIDPAVLAEAEALISPQVVHGARYDAAAQADVDTEEFA
ncbi:MAG: aldo/keto reductase [Asticcacaulis sp.]